MILNRQDAKAAKRKDPKKSYTLAFLASWRWVLIFFGLYRELSVR
jgi:hypothetical protein